MRIFVTGSTGYVGSAVVRALVQAGHEVGGLARSVQKEDEVRALGAVPIFGNLHDPERYQHFAAECDAVVHCAFATPELDELALEELAGALLAEGGQKALIYTSGVWVLGSCPTAADEDAPTDRPLPMVAWRPAVERFALSHATEDLACAVIRPGLVYGGDGGYFAGWLANASRGEPVTFVGEGQNRFPPVHRDDLAQLYRRVVEKRARGIFHGVDGSAPTVAEAAGALSEAGGNGPARPWPLAQARQRIGAVADALALDQVVVAKRAADLGWLPRGTFLESAPALVREKRD